MDLFKPIREFFQSQEGKETDISRRNFLLGVSAVTGLVVVQKVFPFRSYSFANGLRPLNVPGSLFQVGDRFQVENGVIYEVIEIDHSQDALRYAMGPNPYKIGSTQRIRTPQRYSLPFTEINEYEFRDKAKQIGRVDASVFAKPTNDWTHADSIRQRVTRNLSLKNIRDFSYDIHGSRQFNMERNGSVNQIITKFYQGEES